jgi:cytochrome c553
MEGRGIMPPFQDRLSSQDINDLVRYLHTLSKSAGEDANTAGHQIPGP